MKKLFKSVLIVLLSLQLLTVTVFATDPVKTINMDDEVISSPPSILPSAFKGPNGTNVVIDGTWTDVRDTSAFPYVTIAYLKIKYKNNQKANGTGFLVSSKCLLTAGHVFFFERDLSNPAVSITAYFGVPYGTDDESITGCKYTITVTPNTAKFIYEENMPSVSTPSVDYGAIVFNSNLPLGHLGYASYSSSTSLENKQATVTGYYVDQNNKIVMKTGNGKIYNVLDTQFYHSADTTGGMSGSPVYDAEQRALGINVAETSSGDLKNWAYRINHNFLEKLRANGGIS